MQTVQVGKIRRHFPNECNGLEPISPFSIVFDVMIFRIVLTTAALDAA
jgi:hypothetical protein